MKGNHVSSGVTLYLTDSTFYLASDTMQRIIFRAAKLVRQVGDSRKYSGENNSSDSFLSVSHSTFYLQSAIGRVDLHSAWIKR